MLAPIRISPQREALRFIDAMNRRRTHSSSRHPRCGSEMSRPSGKAGLCAAGLQECIVPLARVAPDRHSGGHSPASTVECL